MKQLRYIVVATAIAAAAAAVPEHAQGRRPMTLIDLAELPRALDPQISPDGRSVTYMLQRPDWSANRLLTHIWRQDTGGGVPEQLTFGDSGEAFARWAPDGETLLFLRGGQIWLLPRGGGEPRALTRHATGVASPTWSPDGMTIYFSALEPRTTDERDRERLKDDVYELDEGYKQRHLWKVVVTTGAEQRITSGESTVLSFRLSRDGRRIALERAPSPLAGDVYRGEVWVMDANGEHARVLTHNSNWEDGPELSPDNSQVLFLADMNERFEPYYNTTLFVMPAGGGTPKPVLSDSYSFDRATWAPDGKSIIAVLNMGVHNEIFQVDVTSGRAKQLTDGEHSIPATPAPAWAIEPRAGKIVFLLESATGYPATPRRHASRTCTTRSSATLRCRVRKRWSGRAPMGRPSRGCSSIRSATTPGHGIRSSSSFTAARTRRTDSAPAPES